MKIKRVISLCKSSGQLILFDDKEKQIQWLSDGRALYPLFGFPYFEAGSICETFDISDSQIEKMSIKEHEELPKHIDFSDTINFENEIVKHSISLFFRSTKYIPFITNDGIIFLDSEHLSPFADYGKSDLSFFERTLKNSEKYIVVKNGFELIGIILPTKLIDGQFIEDLSNLKKMCDFEWLNIRRQNAENQSKANEREEKNNV